MKITSNNMGYQRLRSIVDGYLRSKAELEKQIDSVQKDTTRRPEYIADECTKINKRLSAERRAAAAELKELKTDYGIFAQEQASPFSVMVDKLTGNKSAVALSDGDLRLLQSMNYLPMASDDYKMLAQIYDPEIHPAMCAAIRQKAEQSGYKIDGWYQTIDEKLKEFNAVLSKAEQIVNPSGGMANDADMWIPLFIDEINQAVDAASGFNDDGSRKVKEITVEFVPKTVEDLIAQDIKKTKEETKPTLADEVEAAKAFGTDPEPILMAEALKTVHDIKFEKQYASVDDVTPADQTAAEQVEKVTLGGAVE